MVKGDGEVGGALLVAGMTSDAGKSVLTAGLLRARTVAALAGRDFTVSPGTGFAALRQARLDVLGDLVAGHLDTPALSRLIGAGPPRGLPVVASAGPGRRS